MASSIFAEAGEFASRLAGQDLLSCQDWPLGDLEKILDLASRFQLDPWILSNALDKKLLLLVLDGMSTRTRVSFQAAMMHLGGRALDINPQISGLARGESLLDTASVLAKYGNGIVVRGGRNLTHLFAEYADIPVIGVGDQYFHPCQGLADLLTIKQRFGDTKRRRYVQQWVYSKSPRSPTLTVENLLLMTRFGMDVVVSCPPECTPSKMVLEQAEQNANLSGGSLSICHDSREGCADADVIYCRNWHNYPLLEGEGISCTSRNTFSRRFLEADEGGNGLGSLQEWTRTTQDLRQYRSWICNQDLLDIARPEAIVMHCMPVFRGEEATDDVLDGPHSVLYQEAENRLFVQMAVLMAVLA